MSESKLVDPTEPPGGGRIALLRRIAVAAVSLLAITLLAIALYSAMIQRSAEAELVKLQELREDLVTKKTRLDNVSGVISESKRIVLAVLRACRTVEDIPRLGGRWIVAAHHGTEDHAFYVPKGEHTLEITASWSEAEPRSGTASAKTSAEQAATEPFPAGKRSWRVPLIPESSYWLHLPRHHRVQPVEWSLTSNHADFESRDERVLVEEIEIGGWSYRSDDVVAFPNQVSRYGSPDLVEAAKSAEGVLIGDFTLRGRSQGRLCKIDFQVRITSDGPAHLPASQAVGLFSRHQPEPPLIYRGGGMYEIRVDEAASPAIADGAAERDEQPNTGD